MKLLQYQPHRRRSITFLFTRLPGAVVLPTALKIVVAATAVVSGSRDTIRTATSARLRTPVGKREKEATC